MQSNFWLNTHITNPFIKNIKKSLTRKYPKYNPKD